ncbi:hypothetical protein CBR_g50443 [Chara braunii]|uniref:Reverse transcriptase domain-containing protein n=1 Tax=Chara braunii TaxID=69332 RepID=A0A388M6X7_CHABU|nr:hypothetical protein CBR_g50443 [Chara braunii]|eukprot:GBG90265.1 hypothetical protein CBR_g50443 [Chara braunii]
MVFQEEARFLSRQVKEDLVRAYEEGWMTQKIFNPETRRGRIRFEGQNVISYVAKAKEVAKWLLKRGEEKLKLGSKEYLTMFKPWMPRQEIRDLRLQEAESKFWIVALRVQLDAYYYLPSAVRGVFGEIRAVHPQDFDKTRPKLMNVKIDMHPDTRFNVDDVLVIESPRGERWTVEIATPYTDWCRKCKWYFHTEENCPRLRQEEGGWKEGGQRVGGHRERFQQHLRSRNQPAGGESGAAVGQQHRSQEADIWGRWAWFRLEAGGEEWVIMTVYAPTEAGERARFFTNLSLNIPKLDNLLIAGDWNLTLDEALKPESKIADRKDVRALLTLAEELNLADPYRILSPDGPGYTWQSHLQRQRGGQGRGVTRRRLNYFLTAATILERFTRVQQISDPLSDHKPVMASIKLQISSERGRGFFRLNSQILDDLGLRDWVGQHMRDWARARHLFQSAEDWADGGIAIVSGMLDVCSRIMAKARNQKEAECKRKVEEAEARMEEHPISALTWAAERERRLAVWEDLQMEKERRWTDLLKEKGIETSNKMNKETFQRLLPRRSMQQMVELKHPFNETAPTASTASGMLEYAKLYYEDILTTRRPQDGVHTDLTEVSDFWEDTQVRIPQAARLDLDRPLTLEETTQTLKSMARGKSPGIDGLTVEFYVKCWEEIGPPLVDLNNGVLSGGRLGERMTHEVISVLFKKGDKAEVRNWRPVSLLNVSYKILAKSLARRLGRYLLELVENDQGAFVQGRSIFNNIVTTIEVLEVIQAENLDTTVLLLDLEKAYDKESRLWAQRRVIIDEHGRTKGILVRRKSGLSGGRGGGEEKEEKNEKKEEEEEEEEKEQDNERAMIKKRKVFWLGGINDLVGKEDLVGDEKRRRKRRGRGGGRGGGEL